MVDTTDLKSVDFNNREGSSPSIPMYQFITEKSMCICINCNHIAQCNTYYLIESQHKQLHLSENPIFTPEGPVICVNISNNGNNTQTDWDLIECLSFVEKPNSWNLGCN